MRQTLNTRIGQRVVMGIINEIWGFLRVRKKFWLAPIILALLLLGGLIVLGTSAGVISPFVYMM